MKRVENIEMIDVKGGSRYSGWQVQGNTEQTIQGKLQSVLEKMTGEEIEIHGSGRTDAGVHAMGQVANFKLQSTASVSQQIKRSKKDLLLPHFLRGEAGCIPEKICNTGGRKPEY